MRLDLLLVVIVSASACSKPTQVELTDTGDQERPIVDRHRSSSDPLPDARAFDEWEEKNRLDHERRRVEYLALPPTATPAPAGSILIFKNLQGCPEHYGIVLDDAGAYCGKVCDSYAGGLCDYDDAGDTSCCGRHRCDRRMKNTALFGGPPDGPMPLVCSRDEKAEPRPGPKPSTK